MTADCSEPEGKPSLHEGLVDITHDVFNVYYHFDRVARPDGSLKGQSQSDQPDNEAARDLAFKECTKIVVNSGVATACGPHFDGDIMVPLNICMQGEAVYCVTQYTTELNI